MEMDAFVLSVNKCIDTFNEECFVKWQDPAPFILTISVIWAENDIPYMYLSSEPRWW